MDRQIKRHQRAGELLADAESVTPWPAGVSGEGAHAAEQPEGHAAGPTTAGRARTR